MDIINQDQREYWNSRVGETWSAVQPLLDRQIGPLGLRAMEALGVAPGERILDIGCGCGDTTLELARRGAAVTGIDLSAPMLAVARRRAEAGPTATFLEADAQTVRFDQPFDAAFSRFGVMFFTDPAGAFRNIHAALTPRGRLAFVCWRGLEENPWLTEPLTVASPHLPPQPEPGDPEAPGPTAFANPDRVRRILADAGFSEIGIAGHEEKIGGFAVEEALILALRIGPLGRALAEAPDARDAATQAIRDALRARCEDGLVWFPSATWIVTARS